MNESLLPRSGVLLCAVSGGADSVYLLHKLRELAGETGYVLECAHFNHCLRGAESDRDEDFMRDYTTKLMQDGKGTAFEIILKDTHTIQNDPSRLRKWTDLCRECAAKVFG